MNSKKILVLLLIITMPLFVGCVAESNAESPIPIVSYSVIASGDNTMSGLPENRKIEVFSDQVSLNSSLALYVQFITEYTVDFSSNRVVILSMGGRSSGGYAITAEAVENHGAYIKLKVLMTKPGSNCVTTQSITSPYEFIEIESIKELVVEERVKVVECN